MCVVFLEDSNFFQWMHRARKLSAFFLFTYRSTVIILRLNNHVVHELLRNPIAVPTTFACDLLALGAGKPFLLMLKDVVELRETNKFVAMVLWRFELLAGLAVALRFFELSA